MSTTAEHIAARDDENLRARLVATAEMMKVPDAYAWVAQNISDLVSVPVTVGVENTSVTATYSYAAAVRREYMMDDRMLPPGLNPGAVTDPILAAAVTAVLNPEPEPPVEPEV